MNWQKVTKIEPYMVYLSEIIVSESNYMGSDTWCPFFDLDNRGIADW